MPQIDKSTSDGFQNNENTASANFNKFVNNTEKVKASPSKSKKTNSQTNKQY